MAVTSFESGSASMLTRAIATDRRITFKASSVMPHSTFLHMKKSSSLQDCMRSGLTSAYSAAVFRCRIHHFTFCQGRSAGGDETLNQVLPGAESLRHVAGKLASFAVWACVLAGSVLPPSAGRQRWTCLHVCPRVCCHERQSCYRRHGAAAIVAS